MKGKGHPTRVYHSGYDILLIPYNNQQPLVQVSLSVVEIYCERIRDLLAPAGHNADNLAVLKNKVRGVFVAGATEIPVHSEEELITHMNSGIANRTVAATGMNATSSRSHCVVSLCHNNAGETN